MTAILPGPGAHLRDLHHLDLDLTVDKPAPGPDHVWFHCHDLVDSAGLLRAAAEHVLRRLGRAGRGEQEYYLRAAEDHERHQGCPAMQAIGRLCMFEQHALAELGGAR